MCEWERGYIAKYEEKSLGAAGKQTGVYNVKWEADDEMHVAKVMMVNVRRVELQCYCQECLFPATKLLANLTFQKCCISTYIRIQCFINLEL